MVLDTLSISSPCFQFIPTMTVKKKNKKLTLLADNLSAVYGQQQWGRQWHLFSLVQHWPELAGSEFASHSMPAFFRQDELWIYARDSIWMQQMHFSKLDIISRINAFLKGAQSVEDIRWTLEPADLIEIAVREEYISPPTDVDPEAERQFRMLAENVKDPKVRAALLRLWLRLETKNKV